MSDTGGARLMDALQACPWRPRRLDLSANSGCASLFAASLARCLQCVLPATPAQSCGSHGCSKAGHSRVGLA